MSGLALLACAAHPVQMPPGASGPVAPSNPPPLGRRGPELVIPEATRPLTATLGWPPPLETGIKRPEHESLPSDAECASGRCWFHAGFGAWVPVRGAGTVVEVHCPRAPADAHSLAELSIRGPSGPDDSIEIGWMVSRARFGDDAPHLFVHRWIAGAGCSDDCGWHQRSGRWAPGSDLSALVGHPAAMGWLAVQGRWWAWFEGEWLGYFEDPLWEERFAAGAQVQWFGEVYGSGDPPQVAMGDGRLATGGVGARFRDLCVIAPDRQRCEAFRPVWRIVTRPALYSAVWDGTGFRYGGTGASGTDSPGTSLTPPRPPSSARGEGSAAKSQ